MVLHQISIIIDFRGMFNSGSWRDAHKGKNANAGFLQHLNNPFKSFVPLGANMGRSHRKMQTVSVISMKIWEPPPKTQPIPQQDKQTSFSQSLCSSTIMPQTPIIGAPLNPNQQPITHHPHNQQTNKIPLCCRTYFIDNEQLTQPQSQTIQYKKYNLPFYYYQIDILRKTICSFLNNKGGIIFIGIEQNKQTKQHLVKGMHINEGEKEDLLKLMRAIVEFIEPDILLNTRMLINFVPVRGSCCPFKFLAGKYVMKITVKEGTKDDIYRYRWSVDSQFSIAVRTQNQVLSYDLKRDFNKILTAMKQRLRISIGEELGVPRKLHKRQNNVSHTCPQPEEGYRIFQANNRITNCWKHLSSNKLQQPKLPTKAQVKNSSNSEPKQQQQQRIQSKTKHPFNTKNRQRSIQTRQLLKQHKQLLEYSQGTKSASNISHSLNMNDKDQQQPEQPSLNSIVDLDSINTQLYDLMKSLRAQNTSNHYIYCFVSKQRSNVREQIIKALPSSLHLSGQIGSRLLIWQFPRPTDHYSLLLLHQQINILSYPQIQQSNQSQSNHTHGKPWAMFKLSLYLKLTFPKSKQSLIMDRIRPIIKRHDGFHPNQKRRNKIMGLVDKCNFRSYIQCDDDRSGISEHIQIDQDPSPSEDELTSIVFQFANLMRSLGAFLQLKGIKHGLKVTFVG